MKQYIARLWHNFRYFHFDKYAFAYGLIPEPKAYGETNRIALADLSKQWKTIAKAEAKHPIAHFFYVKIPDFIEDLPHMPIRTWNHVSIFLFYYFIKRNDIVKLKDIKRGYWWDTDTRMQSAIVQLFIDHIEIECAAMASNNDFRSLKRNPQLGVKYIKKQIKANKSFPLGKKCGSKNVKGFENILEAYKYFTVDRVKLQNKLENLAPSASRKSVDKYWELDNEIINKDTKYLVMIIQERNHLWT